MTWIEQSPLREALERTTHRALEVGDAYVDIFTDLWGVSKVNTSNVRDLWDAQPNGVSGGHGSHRAADASVEHDAHIKSVMGERTR